jgi:hypothetical protein
MFDRSWKSPLRLAWPRRQSGRRAFRGLLARVKFCKGANDHSAAQTRSRVNRRYGAPPRCRADPTRCTTLFEQNAYLFECRQSDLENMKRVVLIACASQKLPHAAMAKDLYVSSLFRLCLRYAQALKPDGIFILCFSQIPYATEQGIISAEQGISGAGTGNFTCQNRNHCRVRFSVRTTVDPSQSSPRSAKRRSRR